MKDRDKKCQKCGGIVEIVDDERYHVCHQDKKCCPKCQPNIGNMMVGGQFNCLDPFCECHQVPIPDNYAREGSHSHCWNQGKSPACGQPLEEHKQCCLCDTPTPSQEPRWWEKPLVEKFNSASHFCSCMEGDMYDAFPEAMRELKSFIAEVEDRARENEK